MVRLGQGHEVGEVVAPLVLDAVGQQQDLLGRQRDDGALVVTGMEPAQVGDLAAEAGLALHELTPVRASLEEAFMELTHDSVEYRAGVGA